MARPRRGHRKEELNGQARRLCRRRTWRWAGVVFGHGHSPACPCSPAMRRRGSPAPRPKRTAALQRPRPALEPRRARPDRRPGRVTRFAPAPCRVKPRPDRLHPESDDQQSFARPGHLTNCPRRIARVRIQTEVIHERLTEPS